MKSILIIIVFLLPGIVCSQQIVDYSLSSCDRNSHPDFLIHRIVHKEIKNDTLSLIIGFPENCCVRMNPKMSYKNDTLYLIESAPDTSIHEKIYCFCDCCFELNLLISGIQDTNFVLKADGIVLRLSSEKYRTYPISFYLENGDTINYTDKYGLRQGLWKFYNQGTNALEKELFLKSEFFREDQIIWRKQYYPSGHLMSYCEYTINGAKYYTAREYKKLIKDRRAARAET